MLSLYGLQRHGVSTSMENTLGISMWTLDEAADKLGYHRNYIRQLCREGKIKARKQGFGRQAPWVVLELQYTLPPKTKINRNEQARIAAGNKTITLRYLDQLEPLSVLESQAILVVKDIINGRRRTGWAITPMIIDYLEKHDEASPRDIALALKLKPHNVRVTMARLVERGDIQRVHMGVYRSAKSNP